MTLCSSILVCRTRGELTCVGCNSGHYLNQDTETCTQCPHRKTTEHGVNASSIDDCLCEPGSFLSNGTQNCDLCEAAYYKNYIGNGICTACPDDKITAGPGSTTREECQCPPGEYLTSNGECTYCDVGSYKNTVGNQACSRCPANMTTTNSRSVSLQDCVCLAGFRSVEGTCEACPAGSYSNTTGASICVLCPVDTFNAESTSTSQDDCRQCPAQTQSLQGSNKALDCVCVAGRFAERDGTVWACSQCPAGSFSERRNASRCELCPAGTASGVVGADHHGVCLPCRNGTTATSPGTATCEPCAPGTFTNISHVDWRSSVCTPCPVGFFGGGAQCTPCPLNSSSSTGSAVRRDCECDPGSFGPRGGPCEACPPEKVCEGGVEPPQSCSRNSRPTELNVCACNPGFFGNSSHGCRICTAGSYCPGGASAVPCPGGNTSDPGAASLRDCVLRSSEGCEEHAFRVGGECRCEWGYYDAEA